MHALFYFYKMPTFRWPAAVSLSTHRGCLSPLSVCTRRLESLAACLTSDAIIVMESNLDMWSRGWSITLSLLRLLEKLLVYKTIKSQC